MALHDPMPGVDRLLANIADTKIARRFIVADLSDQPWHIRVRSGLPFELRRWGNGYWTVANGEPHYFPTRVAAEEAGQRWVVTGRTPA